MSSMTRRLLPLVALTCLLALGLGGWLALRATSPDPAGAADDDGAPHTTESADEPTRAESSSSGRTPRRERRRRGPDEPGAAPTPNAPATAAAPPPVLESLIVAKDTERRLPAGRVHVRGDVRVEGRLVAPDTTLVLDGGDQTLAGRAQVGGLVLRGGVKRLQGAFATVSKSPAAAGASQLVVGPDTTLVIDETGSWSTPNPYGYRIEGHLVVDGGTFRCVFFNGDGAPGEEGRESRADSWAPGSTLTIRRGAFEASGDADFRGATVTIHDGRLAVNDDLWSLGDRFVQYGGTVTNSRWGGAFGFTGRAELYGGVLNVQQSTTRGLYLQPDVVFQGTGGHIRISGKDAPKDKGGIKLLAPLNVGRLTIGVTTHVHPDSGPGAYVSVADRLEIAKGKTFEAAGRPVYAAFESTAENGTLVR